MVNQLLLHLALKPGAISHICICCQHAGLHLDLRELNRVRLVRDKTSTTGLAAVLGPGGTWGHVLKVIPPEK